MALCIPFCIFIESFIMSISILLICILDYKEEDLSINAIEKTWKNYPIFNLSLTPLEGYEEITFMTFEGIDTLCDCIHVNKFNKIFKRNCDEYEFISGCIEYSSNGKATKIYNSSLYAKYYEADYMTLFNRIKKDTLGRVCNEEFEKCGYLDLNQNTFCVKRGELCPINSNIQIIFDGNGKIARINYNRGDTTCYILNRIYVSDVDEATIFDINKFYISNYEKSKQKKDECEKFYRLGKLMNYKNISKNEFYAENSLINGSVPEYFKSSNIYLYHLKYPANSDEVYLGELALYLLKKPNRIILKATFLIVKAIFLIVEVFFSLGMDKFPSFKLIIIFLILQIIITIALLGLTIINIIYIKQKYNLHKLLYYTNITTGKGIATFIFQIIFEIIPEILIFFYALSTLILIILELKGEKEKEKKNLIKNDDKNTINDSIIE